MKSLSFAVTTFSTFVFATGSLATGSLALAESESTSSGATATTSNSYTTVFTVAAKSSQIINYSNAKPTEKTIRSLPGGFLAEQNFSTTISGSKPGNPPNSQARKISSVTVFTVPAKSSQTINYSNAKPMEKTIRSLPGGFRAEQNFSTTIPGSKPGNPPNSQVPKILSVQLVNRINLISNDNIVESNNFGTLRHPFTTVRNQQTTGYPYSPSGKLFFNTGNSTSVCSASVIERGVVVTAAHCVANFGASEFYSNWEFIPAYNNGNAPYGAWTANKAIILTSYYEGTDRCSVRGVACDNDVAVLVMTPKSGYNVGDYTGWYGVAYGGFGYTSFLNDITASHLTQIGYPVSLDNGAIQQRNDSLSYTKNDGSYQQIIGSLMTGGSSGGPWLLNYGVNPNISSPNTLGQNWTANPLVMGVTSWGYTDGNFKEQGASFFTADNIQLLLDTACTETSLLACN